MVNGPQSTTQPSGDEVREAAVAVLSDQHPEAAAIYQKQSRGEKLSQREWGIVGWLRKKFAGKADAPGKSAEAGNGDAPAVAPVAPAQAAPESLPDAPADPGIVRRTTGAVISRLESRDKRKVQVLCDSARAAGLDAKVLARIERSAALPTDDKGLLLELSPDVFRELGIDPRKYATVVFFGVFALWRLDMMEAIEELRAIVKGKEPEPQPVAKPAYNFPQSTYPHNPLPPVVPSPITAKPGGDIHL